MPSYLSDTADFPPLVTPHRLRERRDAFSEAVARALEEGAGSLFFVGRFELLEFAIVLEPAEPLRLARKIFFAGMNAMADALSALAPPEKPIAFRYPGSLYFDGALIGGGRLAVPTGCGEDQPPDWLVFGGMVRAGGMRDMGTGLAPEITTLDDEGFENWSPELFAASFARHFMVEVDSWGEKGFSGIGPRYLGRLEKVKGQGKRGIDVNGDLLIHPASGAEGAVREDFRALLAAADWYDSVLNEPRS
jgi:biotin-(acetyl-CoA carboxylase) ligase